MTDAPKSPEEKTPGEGAPDLGTERPETSSSIVETIDEIPMGGVPEPGEAPVVDTGEERTSLTDMPEDTAERDLHGGHAGTTGLSNNKLAMWLFLGSECLLFGGLISTYMLYRGRHSGSLGPDQIYDIPFTSVSSFVLLMSSLTMVLAVSSVARGDLRNTKLWLTVTALLGATFVGGQVYEFTSFYREGLGFTTSLFSSSFYTLTGFHGVHVTVGIIMLLALVGMISRNRVTGEKSEVVELVGLYWHFVDIVWIVIFTLVYLIPRLMTTDAHPTAHAGEDLSADEYGDHQHGATDKQYIIIALILALITAAEVTLTYLDVGPLFLPALLIMMAAKFIIVVSFFMHLKFDNKLFSFLFYLGLLLAVFVYAVALATFHFFT